MLNIIAIYVICLYLISLAAMRTDDGLISGILFIVGFCLAVGFLYYSAVILSLSAINTLGFLVLTVFPLYLGTN